MSTMSHVTHQWGANKCSNTYHWYNSWEIWQTRGSPVQIRPDLRKPRALCLYAQAVYMHNVHEIGSLKASILIRFAKLVNRLLAPELQEEPTTDMVVADTQSSSLQNAATPH